MNSHDQTEIEQHPRNAQVTAALRMLAAATPEIDYTAIEERLQLAFADQQRSSARARRLRQWGRVAAVLLVMCGAAGWWLSGTRVTAPLPLDARSLVVAASGVAVPFAPPATRSAIRVRATAATDGHTGSAMPVDRLENALARLADFIPLPGAAMLPEFERGDIVRIEVPVAGLAAYGFDMVPDAAPASVAADLLIGQDGVPRAIRLTSERVR